MADSLWNTCLGCNVSFVYASFTSRARLCEEAPRGTTVTVTQIQISPFVAGTSRITPCFNYDCLARTVRLTSCFAIWERHRGGVGLWWDVDRPLSCVTIHSLVEEPCLCSTSTCHRPTDLTSDYLLKFIWTFAPTRLFIRGQNICWGGGVSKVCGRRVVGWAERLAALPVWLSGIICANI